MINFEIKDNVVVVSLDNEKGNLLKVEDLESLGNLLRSEDVQASKGLVLTGLNHSFCTGLYLDESVQSAEKIFRLLDELLLALYSFDKPLVIALSGHAIGAGFLFLQCADYVYVADSKKAKYGLPEIKLGLGLDLCMLRLLEYSLSPVVVKHFLYSGLFVNYEYLLGIGLADKLVKSSELLSESLSLINYIDTCQQPAFSYCKKLLRQQNVKELSSLLETRCFLQLLDLYKNKNYD